MRIQSVIKPMSVSISTITVGGSNTQLYDTELQEYIPDYRLAPVVIALKAQKGEDGIVSAVTTFIDTLVYEQVDDVWVQRNSTPTFVINVSAGTITIKENLPVNSSRRFKIDTKIADSRRIGIPYLASVDADLNCKIMSDSPFKLVHEYLDGQGAYVIRPLDNYRLKGKMMKGDTEWIQAYYRWYRRVNNVDTEITTDNAKGITGLDSDTVSIPYVEIPDREVSYKCVADPVVDMIGVNLISKKMISDDWNAIAAGTSVPGQDADGKYFAINQALLYDYFGPGKADVFSGKIKYKTNQQYSLSVSWKMQTIQDGNGLQIGVEYVDGLREAVVLGGGKITKLIATIITKPGRSIKFMYASYGENKSKSLIYDIQLVEVYGSLNFVTGGLYNRVPVTGTSTGAVGGGVIVSEGARRYLTVGSKFTLSFMNVITLSGTNSVTLTYYDNNGTKRDQGQLIVNNNAAFNIQYDGTTGTEAIILTLAATNGATEYWGAMLVLGGSPNVNYKYTPMRNEFLPAIPDGAPKPLLSANAKTDIMVLSRKYPANPTERGVQTYNSNLPGNVTNVFGAQMNLDTASGTIERPELSYSCLWHQKPLGGVESLLARGFNIMESYDELIDLRTEVKQGLDNAKWAANFNGIDQTLVYVGVIANTTPVKNKTYEVTFRCNKALSSEMHVFLHVRNDASYSHRAIFSITPAMKIKITAIKNDSITDWIQKSYESNTSIRLNEIYKVVIRFDANGDLSYMEINGIKSNFITTTIGGGIGGGSYLHINYPSYPAPVTLLDFKYIHRDTELLLHYDFQPLNGDRSNMLKSKNTDGSALASPVYTLIPSNISNLDDLNPLTGFFTTI